MIISFRHFRKMFVFVKNTDEDTPVALLFDCIIDPDKGKIQAFWVKTPDGKKILNPENIIEWSTDHISIQSEKDFLDPEDAARLQEVFRKEVPIIGNTVLNRQKKVGEVYDFSFDSISLLLMQIFIRNGFLFFGKTQIVHRSKIVKITHKGIFIAENSIRSLDASGSVADSLV